MSLDTLLEEDEKARLAQPKASDAELAQMTGVQPDVSPVPENADTSQLHGAGDDMAPPPTPVPAAPGPQTAVDPLAQVQRGQLSRPAVDRAFGPPPTLAPAPAGASQGLDWQQLAKRLESTRSQAHENRLNNMLLTAGTLGGGFHPVDDEASQVAAAEEPLKLAEARQGMDLKQAQEERARAASLPKPAAQKSPEEQAHLQALTDLAKAQTTAVGAPQALKKDEDAATAQKFADETARKADLETGATFEADRDAIGKVLGKDLSGIKSRAALDKILGFETSQLKPRVTKGTGKPPVVAKEGDYSSIPESEQPLVRAIVNGQAPAPSASAKNGQQTLRWVLQVDPKFDANAYGMRSSTLGHMAKEKDISALPVAIHHIDLAEQAINSMQSFDAPTLNRIAKAVINGEGSDQFSGHDFAIKVAADEVASAYGINTERGKEEMAKLFDPRGSKEQKLAVLAEAKRFIAGKIEGLQENVTRADPKNISNFNLMTPSVKQSLGGGGAAEPKEGDEKTPKSGRTFVYRSGEWVLK